MGSLAFGSAGPALIEGLGEHEREAILRVLLERALRLCAQEGCRGLEAALPPLARAQLENRSGASPLDPLGFSSISTSTYVLDLRRDETELLAGFRQAVRRAIRMAEKEGVQIRPADRPEDAETYYRLHCETYERTGATPHPAAYFKGIFEKMAPRGLCQIWTAEREGRPLAFANIGLFKKTAYYWTGCGSEEGLQVGANHLLQWRVIQRLKADGVEWYEVGEAFPAAREGDKKAGLDLFKRGFGGERRPFFRGRIDMPERAPSRLRLSLYYLKRSLRILLGGR
jgi:lipid II:glycine glycyltransferase (peptidoglycan interpeptide bridge formation enzyme)